jgi:hypothetical protein
MRTCRALLALILLCSGTGVWAARNKPPSVALTAPASGATFTSPANITISANATDSDGTIAKVEFYRDTTSIGTLTSAPYTIVWSNAAAGTYSLTAKATDNAGATKTSSAVSVVVSGPKLLISYPANGASLYGGSVSVTGTFSGDASSTVTVDNGNSTVLATISGSEYRASVPLFDGPNVLRASVARRDRSSDTTSVTVVGNRNPLVVFTAPAGNVLDAQAGIELAVDAVSSANAIIKVDFLRNGSLIGTVTSPPYRIAWANATPGTHALSAIATDGNGYTGTASRSITINGSNVPPTVSLTSPAHGAAFTAPATVPMTASASDSDGAITRLEFLQNGVVVGVTNVAPYTATWTGVTAGSYVLTARATDDRFAVATSAPVTISVGAPNSAPTVSLTSPADGTSFLAPATISLAATATDSDGTVAKVEFYQGVMLVGSSTSPPFNATWTNVGAGNYTLTAKATDIAGAVATSAPIGISVNANQLPTVVVTSPSAGASFAAPATIALAATAMDSDGTIASVEFFQGATPIGVAAAPPYAYNWTNVAAGDYSITARATDNLGGTATSSAVNVSVAGPDFAIDSPLDGATISDDSITVTGTLQSPANSGVTVNGAVAAVAGTRFYANNVQLASGTNAITAVLTTPDGQTANQTVSVTSTGPAPVRIVAGPTQGLSPLTVTIEASPQTGVEIQRVGLDADGDGTVDQTLTAPPWTMTVSYVASGTVTPVISVVHGTGSLSKAIPIVVTDPGQLDQTLRAVWSGMKTSLASGDKAGAMRYLDASAQLRYGPVFDLLLTAMPQIVGTFSDLHSVTLSDGLGEYAINRTIDGENRLFLIYFGRNGDGVWRLGSM